MQNYYNLIHREEEREMVPFCNTSMFDRVRMIPYSPNARGVLAKPLGSQTGVVHGSKQDSLHDLYNLSVLSENEKEIVRRTEEITENRGFSMADVAQAWLISKGCAPIVGLSSEKRVEDTIRSIELKLGEEDIRYLEEPYVTISPVM